MARASSNDSACRHDKSPRTRHITANPVIDVDDEGERPASDVVVRRPSRRRSLPLQPIVTGRYADTFARGDDGRWHWTERRYAIDHAGDLSHHLRLG